MWLWQIAISMQWCSSLTRLLVISIVCLVRIRESFWKKSPKKASSPTSSPLKEFDLLEYLLRNVGRVLTRGQLIDRVWGADYVGDTTATVAVPHGELAVTGGDAAPLVGVGVVFVALGMVALRVRRPRRVRV